MHCFSISTPNNHEKEAPQLLCYFVAKASQVLITYTLNKINKTLRKLTPNKQMSKHITAFYSHSTFLCIYIHGKENWPTEGTKQKCKLGKVCLLHPITFIIGYFFLSPFHYLFFLSTLSPTFLYLPGPLL